MSTDLIVQPTTTHVPVQAQFFDLSPKGMIERAAAIATPLADIIEKQKLYTLIGGRKYVQVTALSTLGTLLGVLPKEEKVIEHPDGTFEAYVSLVNAKTGMVVGGGSAICDPTEKNWKGRDRFAVRSMAITRATGKAYRITFSWILTLAGYEATPAEEMSEHQVYHAEPGEEIYTGKNTQKVILAKLCEKNKISDKVKMANMSQAITAAKVSMKDLESRLHEFEDFS